MMEFLQMGGYARFVWPAFGITLAILVINVVSARRRFRRIQRELAMRATSRNRSTRT